MLVELLNLNLKSEFEEEARDRAGCAWFDELPPFYDLMSDEIWI
jgi:hypothetical protein